MSARPDVAQIRGRRRFAIASAVALAAGVLAALIVAASASGFAYGCSGGACSGTASDSFAAKDVCVPGTSTYFENSELPADAINPTLTKFTIGPPDPPCTGATISTPTVDPFPAALKNPDDTTAAPKPGFAIFRFRFTVTVPANATPLGDLSVTWGISFSLPPDSTSPTTVTNTSTTVTSSTSSGTTTEPCVPVLRVSKGATPEIPFHMPLKQVAALPVHRRLVTGEGSEYRFDYVIVVENDSDCPARDVVFSDTLPPGFAPSEHGVALHLHDGKYASAEVTNPVHDHAVTYATSSIAPHETLILHIPGHASRLGPQHNTARVVASDTNAADTNTATVVATPVPGVTDVTGVNGTSAKGTASQSRNAADIRMALDAGTQLFRLDHVDVAVRSPSRSRSHDCAWLNQRGGFTSVAAAPQGRCDKPRWLRARGTSHWHLRFPRRLPRGRYELWVRAVNRGGVYDVTFSRTHHNLVAFTVR